MNAVFPEPQQNLQIERIAILALVHHDLVETRRQCTPKCHAIHGITNQLQRLGASIAGAQITCLQ